jgi:uncharacterized protein (DUF362 family)
MFQDKSRKHVSRRDFLKVLFAAGGSIAVAPFLKACERIGLIEPTQTQPIQPTSSPVIASATPYPTTTLTPIPIPKGEPATLAFVKTRNRIEGVRQALEILEINPVQGKGVLLKPNFNSADPAPASTHPATLRSIVEVLWEMGAGNITVADRSGMDYSRNVMQTLGVLEMAQELGFETLSFEDLQSEEDWELIQFEGSHWKNGFPIARPVLNADAIVQTCCLKPHRFGGHFTLSLKNTIGMVGKFMGNGGHNYMTDLHTSFYQRLMIAETNLAYTPALVVLDGVEAFINKGPDTGKKVWGEAIIAGTDRVAIDAVGLAMLRFLGYRGVAARGSVFEQEQIARAVELGLGIDTPEKIQLITNNAESEAYAAQIREFLN